MNTQLREVLAEISTVRNLLVNSSDALKAKEEEAKRYHAATRFLLDDDVADYRTFLKQIFGDLDTAITKIVNCDSFEQVIAKAEFTYEAVPADAPGPRGFFEQTAGTPPSQQMIYGSYGGRGGYGIHADKKIRLTHSFIIYFDQVQKVLRARVQAV